ncbi:A disintegrin and metalloproteinase with thrombospondin motifs 12 [Plecturocebus cupreus]
MRKLLLEELMKPANMELFFVSQARVQWLHLGSPQPLPLGFNRDEVSPCWPGCVELLTSGDLPTSVSKSVEITEHFIKSLPEYHVVGPVRVDASGHFLSYGLHHLITSSRRKRDLDGSEDWVYYKISHEEKDLFFNLTVNQRFLSNNYIMEKRYGNLSNVKMMASSAPLCHLSGTVLQQGTRVGTAALSACHGLGDGMLSDTLRQSKAAWPRLVLGSMLRMVHQKM